MCGAGGEDLLSLGLGEAFDEAEAEAEGPWRGLGFYPSPIACGR